MLPFPHKNRGTRRPDEHPENRDHGRENNTIYTLTKRDDLQSRDTDQRGNNNRGQMFPIKHKKTPIVAAPGPL